MFFINKLPSQKDIEKKLALLETLLHNNHIKPNQNLIVSLGMDEKGKNYSMNLIFKDYEGYDSKLKPLIISFPIVRTDGFTAENCKVAYSIFLSCYSQDKKLLEEYITGTWQKYNFKLYLDNTLPKISKKYFTADEIKQITDQKSI